MFPQLAALDAMMKDQTKVVTTVYKSVGDAGGGGAGGAAGGAAAAAAGGGLAAAGLRLLGFGGGSKGWMGMAAGFSLASMAGLGFEHVLTTAIGLAASLVGAIGGGLVLAVSAAGVAFIGMGSDMLVMKTAMTNVKEIAKLQQTMTDAIAQYGANSPQAVTATNNYKFAVGELPPVLQASTVATANMLNATKSLWQTSTAVAQVAAQGIQRQFLGIAQQYMPLIGAAAKRNFDIIGNAIKGPGSLMDFLGGQGKQIFLDLENVFARNLPTSIHAMTQGFELLLKIIDQIAPKTGGIMGGIDRLLTKMNSSTGFPHTMDIVQTMIDMFHSWWGFFKILTQDIYAFFSLSASLGMSVVGSLTDMLTKLHTWLGQVSTQGTVSNIFTVHKNEILAILQLLPPLLTGLGSVYLTVAPALASALTVVVSAIAPLLTAIASNAWGAWALGLLLITGKLGVLVPLLVTMSKLTGLSSLFGTLSGKVNTATGGVIGKDASMLGVQKVFVVNWEGMPGKGLPGAPGGPPGEPLPAIPEAAAVGTFLAGAATVAIIGAATWAAFKWLSDQPLNVAHNAPLSKDLGSGNQYNPSNPANFNTSTFRVGGGQGNNVVMQQLAAAEAAAAKAAQITAAEQEALQGLLDHGVKVTGPFLSSFTASWNSLHQSGADMSLVSGTLMDVINHAGVSTPGQVTDFLAQWARLGLTGKQSNDFYSAISDAINKGAVTNPTQVSQYLDEWGSLTRASHGATVSADMMATFARLGSDNSKQFQGDLASLAGSLHVSTDEVLRQWGLSAQYSQLIASDMWNLKNSMPTSLHVTTGALAMSARGGDIKGFAGGGDPMPGLSWVGEEGPELAAFPGGAHIYPHEQSMMMTRGGGGGGDSTVVIDLRGTQLFSPGDIDVLVDKIGRRIATSILPRANVKLTR